MNRATGTTMKPITLVSAFRHSILARPPCVSSWPYCAVLMHFQSRRVRMYHFMSYQFYQSIISYHALYHFTHVLLLYYIVLFYLEKRTDYFRVMA